MERVSEADKRRVAVIGAGAWGTTIAWLLGGQGTEVALWARDPAVASEIDNRRENKRYAAGAILPDCVRVTGDGVQALTGASIVFFAVPSKWLGEVVLALKPHVAPGTIVVSGTKGLERATGRRMSEVIGDELGSAARIVVLSGPNLSREIISGHPAVSVAASPDCAAAEAVQQILSSGLFRVYTNCDILGVEVCGALKNIIALGAGVSDGLGYGDNAKAALVTRGLAEMGRIGTALGATAETFWGIAGVGDLVATCNSHFSRNWTVGWRLGRGETIERILQDLAGVAEGIQAAEAARDLAAKLGVEAPITDAVCRVLFEGQSPAEAVASLMGRVWRSEVEAWHWEAAGRCR